MLDWGSISESAVRMDRRGWLMGTALLSGSLLLPGCATTAGGGSALNFTEVVRRLLELSTQRAFATLAAEDGFWNSAVARVAMPTLFGKSAGVFKGLLSSGPFREQLQRQLNRFAEDGARKAAPVVADAIRTLDVGDGMALLRGGPTSATTLLRQQMGPAVVNAMIPELDRVMRVANDPIVSQALGALAGVDVAAAAQALALEADNAIWYQVGAEEAAIRKDPASVGDAVLGTALGRL